MRNPGVTLVMPNTLRLSFGALVLAAAAACSRSSEQSALSSDLEQDLAKAGGANVRLGVGARRESGANAQGQDSLARAERESWRSRAGKERAQGNAGRGHADSARARAGAGRGAARRAAAGANSGAEAAAGADPVSSARTARRMEDAWRDHPERAVPDQSVGVSQSSAVGTTRSIDPRDGVRPTGLSPPFTAPP